MEQTNSPMRIEEIRQRIDGIVDDHKRVPTIDFSPPVDADIEIEMESKLAPVENRELDKMRDKLKREHDDDDDKGDK